MIPRPPYNLKPWVSECSRGNVSFPLLKLFFYRFRCRAQRCLTKSTFNATIILCHSSPDETIFFSYIAIENRVQNYFHFIDHTVDDNRLNVTRNGVCYLLETLANNLACVRPGSLWIQTGQNINHVFLNRSIVNELRTGAGACSIFCYVVARNVYTEVKGLSSKNIELSYFDSTLKHRVSLQFRPFDDDFLLPMRKVRQTLRLFAPALLEIQRNA